MPAETTDPDTPGGLLVVSDYPGQKEDNTGRPFVGDTGVYLRPLLRKWWQGPITMDNAVKCAAGRNMPPNAPDKCRPFLAATVRDSKPSRVLIMGGAALMGMTGRSVSIHSVRRGYTWLYGFGAGPVPAYIFPNPVVALRNRMLRKLLEDDLEWALTTPAPPFGPGWQGVAKVVLTLEDAHTAAAELRAAPWFSYDVETAGYMWRQFQVLCASLTAAGSEDAWVWDTEALADPACRAVLADLLRDPRAKKTGANLKYDALATELELGVQLRGVHGDVRLLRKILDTDADGDLETMAELVGMGGHKGEAQAAQVAAAKQVQARAQSNVSNQGQLFAHQLPGVRQSVLDAIKPGDTPKVYSYAFLPRDVRTRYNARDAVSTARLQTLLDQWRVADAPGLTRVYERIAIPASQAVTQIEAWGVPVDMEAIQHFRSHLQIQRNEVQARLSRYGKLNPDSPDDVARLLFEDLKLPIQARTDTGKPSTDADSLRSLRTQTNHPVVRDLLDWRKVTKLDGNYATGMLQYIRDDGRIHPSILLDGARSGRPSCTNPNMQTIPRDSDSAEGKMARDCFAAPPGWTLLSADFSQIELRIAAALSEDPEMIAVFERGEDLHQRTAEWIAPIVWKIPPSQVVKKHRTAAKAFNFGVLYGMSDPGIAERAGCTISEAEQIRAAILGRFKKLDQWIRERLAYARRYGCTWTWWDGEDARRRPLYDIVDTGHDDRTKLRKTTAEHSSWNTPVQGTASDFLVASMTGVVDWILDTGAPAMVCLPVHDSLLMQVRDDAVEEVAAETHRIMTSWNSKGVPIAVDIETGPSWGRLQKMKLAA